jgi:calcipressin-2
VSFNIYYYFRPEIYLRVFRADRNPLIPTDSSNPVPETAYLQPPPIEKNFLISPPGSPPVGWEQVKEDPPNSTPLAADLITALKKLQVHHNSGLEVVMEPEEAGVGVYVEDCDWCPDQPRWVGEDEEEEEKAEWSYGASPMIKWKPAPTALPPLPTAVM